MARFVTPDQRTGKIVRTHDSTDLVLDDDPRRKDREALLRKVVENKDDDVPRLVYADWLDEEANDPVRAEFIRLQVDTFRDPPKHGRHPPKQVRGRTVRVRDECPRCRRLRRLNSLWRKLTHQDRLEMATFPTLPPTEPFLTPWRCGFAEHPKHRLRDMSYRRGFIEKVRVFGDPWVRFGDRLTEWNPINEVVLTARPGVASNSLEAWLSVDPKNSPDSMARSGFPKETVLAHLLKTRFTKEQIEERMRGAVEGDPSAFRRMTLSADPFRHPELPEVLCELRWPGVKFRFDPPQFELRSIDPSRLARLYGAQPSAQNIPRPRTGPPRVLLPRYEVTRYEVTVDARQLHRQDLRVGDAVVLDGLRVRPPHQDRATHRIARINEEDMIAYLQPIAEEGRG